MRRSLLIFPLLICSLFALAEGKLKEDSLHTRQVVELRQSAAFSYDLPAHFDISFEEEIRSAVLDRSFHDGNPCISSGPAFLKSYTTVGLGCKFFSQQSLNTGYKYSLRLDATYTLRYLHNKLYDDSGVKNEVDKFLRHRAGLSLVAAVDFGPCKLSFRERFIADCRTDSVDLREKPKAELELRHRLRLDCAVPGQPVKPYLALELTNTLNQPTCPYLNAEGKPFYDGQYLNSVRTGCGVKWRIDKQNSLSFSYTFIYDLDKDYNITGSNNVKINTTREFSHVLTLSYDLGY